MGKGRLVRMHEKSYRALLLIILVALTLIVHETQPSASAKHREVTVNIQDIVALRSIENLTVAITLNGEVHHFYEGTVKRGGKISARSSFLLNQTVRESLWRLSIIGNINGNKNELLEVSGVLDIQNMTARFIRTYYNPSILYINPAGSSLSFELTDINGFINLKIYFNSPLRSAVKYQAVFTLGSMSSVVNRNFTGEVLNVNSSKITSLTSITPFSINVTITSGLNAEQILFVNGTYIFTPDNISIPCPAQRFNSSKIREFQYTFNQLRYGYIIRLPNKEIVHERAEGKQVTTAERLVTVTVSTGKIESRVPGATGQRPKATSVEEQVKRIRDSLTYIQRNPLGIAMLIGALLTIAWLVRRKRRTGRWLTHERNRNEYI